MGSLPASRIEALLETVAHLDALDDPLPFPAHLLPQLNDLVPSDECIYSELDRAAERSIVTAWWSAGVTEVSAGRSNGLYWQLRHEHPVCGYREQTGDWISARKASDFVSLREFQRREIWNVLYREDRINYWLDIGLPPANGRTRIFIFTRTRRDFAESERLVLELLQPHLVRRHLAATAAAEAAEALATLEAAGAAASRDLVLCSRHGAIEFASARARRLLATYFGRGTERRLPEPLLAEICAGPGPHVASREDRCLTIRVARTGALLVLLVDERDTRVERLTRRQLQILERVASGETDGEIAAALGVAPATVGKHLEQIYTRLGVHNRTAAAALLPRSE